MLEQAKEKQLYCRTRAMLLEELASKAVDTAKPFSFIVEAILLTMAEKELKKADKIAKIDEINQV